jgi:replicative DNA helicase
METGIAPFAIDHEAHLCHERMLIGGLLWSGHDRLAAALELVEPDDLEREDTRLAYRGLSLVSRADLDPIERRFALLDWLTAHAARGERTEKAHRAKLALWMLSLDDPDALGFTAMHARAIRDRAVLRVARLEGRALDERGAHVPTTIAGPLEEFLADAEGKLGDLAKRVCDRGSVVHRTLGEGLVDASLKQVPSLATGLLDLDELVAIEPSDLVLIAARPSVGKTALALQIALNAARAGKHVFLASLEMTADALSKRLLANVAEVDHQSVRSGQYGPGELDRAKSSEAALACLPIAVVDRDCSTVERLAQLIEREKSTRRLDLVVIDYLQLLTARGRHDNRVQELAAISRAVKLLAIDLRVPVIALSQLSRACLEHEKPQLHHLRDSGALEQDADVALLLWDDDAPRVMHVHVAKNRSGSTGDVDLYFDRPTQRIGNLQRSTVSTVTWSGS